MPDDDTIIRASSLPNYPDCNARWAAQTMSAEITAMGWELRETPRGIGAAHGTAVHAAGAHILTGKMKTGVPADPKEGADVGIASLDEAIKESDIAWDDTTPEVSVAQQQIVRQTAMYHSAVVPQIKPIAVEQALRAAIEPGFVLSGHIDVSEELDLHDLKTGKNQRANAAQYGAYALLRRSHGENANKLIEDYVRRGSLRTAQPKPERNVYDGPRAERMAKRIIERIVKDVKTFRETQDPWSFLPNPNTYLCGARWCPAHGTKWCGAWREK